MSVTPASTLSAAAAAPVPASVSPSSASPSSPLHPSPSPSPTPLSFRYATVSDLRALSALIHSAYRGDTSRQGWTTEADLLDGGRIDDAGLLDVIQGKELESKVILAFRPVKCGEEECVKGDGVLVACCELQRRSQDSAYFGMFSVRPTEQGGGIGKAVLAHAEQLARSLWNCSSMHMSVIAQRVELLEFYKRRGYGLTGETSPFPYGQPKFGIPKRDDLHFVGIAKQLNATQQKEKEKGEVEQKENV